MCGYVAGGVVCGEREIYFKELAHVIVETDRSGICRAGGQAGDPGEYGCCSMRTKGFWEYNSLFPRRSQSCLLKAFN